MLSGDVLKMFKTGVKIEINHLSKSLEFLLLTDNQKGHI